MRSGILCAVSAAFVMVAGILPARADTEFRARKMTRTDVPRDKGQCDIRLQVDDEVEVSVRGDLVSVRTISGRDGRDDGSECNAPLPSRNLRGFQFEVADGRGETRLVSEPSRRNGFQAVVHIKDSAPGEGRYHFRLTWMESGRDFDDRDRRGGLVWNNATHLGGPGRGSWQLSDSATQRLADVSVDIDRGGRILVSFRTDKGRPLTFSGSVIGSEGDALKADVTWDDGPYLRGPLYLSRNARGDVSRITLEATDGQSHGSVNWERR